MYHVSLTFQCTYRGSDEGTENGDRKEKTKWRLPDLLYADDLTLCGESEEDLRVKLGWFVQLCRRTVLKVNASKNKEMVLNEEERLE